MAITKWATKDHLGACVFKKDVGEVSNGYAVGDEVVIPYVNCDAREFENNSYSGQANVSAGPVTVARGKKIVRIVVTANAHPAWFIQKALNDWIGGTNGFLDATTLDTSTWSISRYEPIQGHKRYTDCQMESFSFPYNPGGGPIPVTMSWVGIYPAEQGSPDTFSVPTRLTGSDYDTGDVSCASLDLIEGFTFAAARLQLPRAFASGDYFLTKLTSHGIGGTLSVRQAPTASDGNQVAVAQDTLNGTIAFQVGPVTTGVKFTCYVRRDAHGRSSPGNMPGSDMWDYSLGDFANSLTTGYPFAIVAGA